MDRDELLEQMRERVSPEAYQAVLKDLAEAEAAGESTQAVDDLLRAAGWLPLPEVPPVLAQDLRSLFGDAPLKSAHDAVLIFDSRRDRELTGVRGGPDEGWSQTYTSPVADVALDIWTEDGECELDGHVMSHGGEAAAYRAKITGPVSIGVDSDALGRFRIEGLPVGSYELTVDNAQATLKLSVDLTEAP